MKPIKSIKYRGCGHYTDTPFYVDKLICYSPGETQKVVSVKKFQLLSGQDMIRPLEKIQSTGNDKVILIERGTLVPYGNVILDVRNLIDMKKLGVPVVMDCTHTCQSLNPGQTKTSGRKEMQSYTKIAGICGIKGFF